MSDATSAVRPIARVPLALAMAGVVALALVLVIASPLRHVTPALLALAVMLRPGLAPLCLALGLAWAQRIGRAWRTWTIPAMLSLVIAAPLVASSTRQCSRRCGIHVPRCRSPGTACRWRAGAAKPAPCGRCGSTMRG